VEPKETFLTPVSAKTATGASGEKITPTPGFGEELERELPISDLKEIS